MDISDLKNQINFTELGNLLSYQPSNPLLFNSGLFLLLFTSFMAVYGLIRHQILIRTIVVTLFSLYFYYKSSGWYLILMMLTALFAFFISFPVYQLRNQKQRKFLLILSIIVFLSLLGWYKYFNFLLGIYCDFSGKQLNPVQIFLPLGISFYTFELISYMVDVYHRKFKPVKSLLDFSFYISFFPHLVAGPIVRPHELFPQIRSSLHTYEGMIGKALGFIIAGLLKKAVISDYIGVNFVDRIFDNPALYSGVENLLGVYGYTLQIYCDFSGYSDMAVGIALLMGFELPFNFNSPYLSLNITDFWRRWHISLSSWLRDYLYIPMGGNRKGPYKQYLFLFLTMLLGGLWHGASWKFVVWGGLHGIALAVHKLLGGNARSTASKPTYYKFFSWLLTFHFVAFCWIFFRAADFNQAMQVIEAIYSRLHGELFFKIVSAYPFVFGLMSLGFIMHFMPAGLEEPLRKQFVKWPVPLQAGALSLMIWIVLQTQSADIQPFIYFQF